jgi:hypothetical protein
VPRQKNFKRLVRSRMEKTGESYTAARARLEPPAPAVPPANRDPDAVTLARALAAVGVVSPITQAPFTEELLFGAAGGIGFAYLVFVYPGWTSINLDGRFNALYFEKKGFIETACSRLGLPVRVRQMSDPEVTERQLRQARAATPSSRLPACPGARSRWGGASSSGPGGCTPGNTAVSTCSDGRTIRTTCDRP